MLRVGLATVVVLAVLAAPALAFTARAGDRALVESGQVINDDLYMAGGSVSMLGRVTGDLIAAGGSVDVAGAVGDDLFLAGGRLDVEGPVAGSARLAGSNIDLRGTVAQDAVVTGGSVRTTGRIGRDLILGAGDASIAGTVAGKVIGGAGTLRISGTINGPVEVEVGRLVIERTAVIRGPLVYRSDRDAIVDQGARVGQIRREAPRVERAGRPFFAPWQGARFGVLWRVFGFVWLLLLGLLLVAVAPNLLARGAAAITQRPGASLLAGFLAFVAIPAVALVALFTVVGIPLGLIAFVLYGILVYVSHVFAGMALGRLVLPTPQTSPYAAVAIGLLLLALATAIPFLGGWIRFAAVLFGLGAIYLAGRDVYLARRAEGAV